MAYSQTSIRPGRECPNTGRFPGFSGLQPLFANSVEWRAEVKMARFYDRDKLWPNDFASSAARMPQADRQPVAQEARSETADAGESEAGHPGGPRPFGLAA